MGIYDRAIIGGAIGVAFPIGTEYVARGYRVKQLKNTKLSGLLGTAVGAVDIIALLGEDQGWWTIGLGDEEMALLGGFGGASLATGATILILDAKKTKMPLKEGEYGGTPEPEKGLEQKIPEETIGVKIA